MNKIQQWIKEAVYHDQVGIIPRIVYLNVRIHIDVLHYNNRLKRKKSYEHFNKWKKLFGKIRYKLEIEW